MASSVAPRQPEHWTFVWDHEVAMSVEFTDWAVQILRRSHLAARRFNPGASVRMSRAGTGVRFDLTDQPHENDERVQGDGFKWKETNWLKVGDNLGDKSGNISYREYTIEQIRKSLHDQQFHLKFTNGVELNGAHSHSSDWEEWFLHASPRQRSEALGLAQQQGVLGPARSH